jgi:hypothetical protein
MSAEGDCDKGNTPRTLLQRWAAAFARLRVGGEDDLDQPCGIVTFVGQSSIITGAASTARDCTL